MNSKSLQTSGNQSYMMSWFPGAKAQLKYIKELAPHAKLIPLCTHLIASTLLAMNYTHYTKQRIWISFPSLTWKRFGGVKAKNLLRSSNFISGILPFSRGSSRCYRFEVNPNIIKRFVELGFEDESTVNLFTGRKVTARSLSSWAGKKGGEMYQRDSPGLLQLQVLKNTRCPINLPRAREAVRKLSHIASRMPSDANKCRAVMAAHSLNSILRFGGLRKAAELGDGVYYYTPHYKCTSTGRLTEIGGGLQGAPREIKARALQDIPGIYNYDLQAAQAACLLKLITLYNSAIGYHRSQLYDYSVSIIDAAWIRDYVDSKDSADHYADRAGVSKSVWKKCFYATIFGSRGKAVKEALEEGQCAAPGTYNRICSDQYHKIMDELCPLRECVRELESRILDHFEAPSYYRIGSAKKGFALRMSSNQHGLYVTNAVGRTIQVKDAERNWAVKPDGTQLAIRHVVLHLLQGLEQEFISHLIHEISTIQGVAVVSHQHDGFIVFAPTLSEEKAEAAMRKAVCGAKRNSFLANYAKIAVKPLSDPVDDVIDKYFPVTNDIQTSECC